MAPTAANAHPPAAAPAGQLPLLRTGTHPPAAPAVAAVPAVAAAPDIHVDPGDAAAAAGELDPGEATPWYLQVMVADPEDAAMTTADWAAYAQASLAGGADSPDEAATDADILMHEQLKRQAILMARVDPGAPPLDDTDLGAGE